MPDDGNNDGRHGSLLFKKPGKETKKGLNENAYKAQFNGVYAPLGYKIVDKHYVIDEQDAEAIRLIFNLYIARHGYKDICIILAKNSFTTRNGQAFVKNSLYDCR